MNDADLQKLAIKPGQLEPKFDRNVTTYNVILESTVKGVMVTPVTRDSDASWVILVSFFMNVKFLWDHARKEPLWYNFNSSHLFKMKAKLKR